MCPYSFDLDMDMALDTIVPETLAWEHTAEGPEYVAVVSHVCIMESF